MITSPGAQTEVSGASAGDVALANGFAAAQSNGHGQAGDGESTGRGNP